MTERPIHDESTGRVRESATSALTLTVTVNGTARTVAPGTTVAALVASEISAPTGVAVALNDDVLPRDTWESSTLSEGDRVELLTAVQGG